MKRVTLAISIAAILLSGSMAIPSTQFELSVLDDSMTSPWLKSIGDLDGDGRVDIVVGGDARSGLVTYLNRFPDWKRSPVDLDRSFSTDGEAADIDGDGRLDLVATTNSKDRGVVWYRNTGSGWEFNRLCDTSLHDIEVGDIDGDGLADLLGRNQKEWPNGDDNGNRLHLFWQKRGPDGGISWDYNEVPCPPGEGLVLYDIDEDEDPDIIINGTWYENEGSRQWTRHDFADEEGWNHPNSYVCVGDINADGRDDIILSPSELQGDSYKVSWFEAPVDRSAIWTGHTIDSKVETVLHFIGAADFNGDGRVDVATAEMTQGEDPDEVRIHENLGTLVDGKWKDKWSSSTISKKGSHSMRILDANGDGLPDLFGANWRANGKDEVVKLWINKSSPCKSVDPAK